MSTAHLIVIPLDPRFELDMLGFIPSFFYADDHRPAKEQINERYVSGWRPFEGFKKTGDRLTYPGDPPMDPLCAMVLRDEWMFFYPHAWVRIDNPDGTFEICRMD